MSRLRLHFAAPSDLESEQTRVHPSHAEHLSDPHVLPRPPAHHLTPTRQSQNLNVKQPSLGLVRKVERQMDTKTRREGRERASQEGRGLRGRKGKGGRDETKLRESPRLKGNYRLELVSTPG